MRILSGKNNPSHRSSFTIWSDEHGIIHIISSNKKSTPESIDSDFEFIRSLLEGEKVCAIIDATVSYGIFTGEKLKQTSVKLNAMFKAIAIISKTPDSKTSRNVISEITPHGIPTRIFPNEKEAKVWLLEHLQQNSAL